MKQSFLFPDTAIPKIQAAPIVARLAAAIWTTRKAWLIRLYLQLFVYVTNRGTYIDAFAGPQKTLDAWAARLIWEADPGPKRKRIDRFELFEISRRSLKQLKDMVSRTSENKRTVFITDGDANIELPKALAKRPITNPAFCLLDQRSTECSWDLVKAVALHKVEGHKIELFYFLMAGWKNRSLKNLKIDPDGDLLRWWGRDDFEIAIKADPNRLAELFCDRFRNELGYRFVQPFPIYGDPNDGSRGRLQYWMIHASDHEAATSFMVRAFNRLACGYDPNAKQEDFGWTDAELKAQLKPRKSVL